MNKILFFLSACLASIQVNAQLAAFFSHCAFNTPDNKPFVETYLTVAGNSVSFKKISNGKFQGAVEVGVLFSQNGQIKGSRKYNLMSPEQNDTLNRPDLIDLQRFSLDQGEYDLELMLKDKSVANGKTFSVKEKVKIEFPADKVNISEIEMLGSFTKAEAKGMLTKNGFDLMPYISDFYPEKVGELSFYAEIYNTKAILGENEKFLLNYYVEKFENKSPITSLTAFKREVTSPISVLMSKFNIAELPSGNYNLVIDVKNKSNELVAQRKAFFQRKNANAKTDLADLSGIIVENTFASKVSSKDTLADFLRSLRPIASQSEKHFIDNQVKLADPRLMQQFLYNFWQSRYPLAPEEGWKVYQQGVRAVNAKFGTLVYKGYETDRGRVFLQYGPPDKREESPSEPNAYPYEIWVYYKLEDKSGLNPNQTNRQFIFYNAELATNNYQLLHSDATSENHDARWQMKLHKRTVQSHDLEMNSAPGHFGGNSGQDYKNPK